MGRQIAQQFVSEAVDAFKVLKEQNQSLEMRDRELAVNAVERVRHGVRNPLVLEERLKLEDVITPANNLLMLRL
jgi:predicted DNA-binding protein